MTALGKRVPELAQALASGSGNVNVDLGRSTQAVSTNFSNALNPADSPITPEPSNFKTFLRLFVVAAIFLALLYFFLHR